MFGFSKRFYFFKRGICLLITALMLILNGTGSSLDTDKAKLFSITGSKNTLLSVYSHCFYEPTVKLTSNMPMGSTKTHTMYLAEPIYRGSFWQKNKSCVIPNCKTETDVNK